MSIIHNGSVFDTFSHDVWNPFGNCFSSFFINALSMPHSNFTSEAHVFKADLPGLKKKVLQISGERSKEQEEKNDKWHSMEMSSGKFLRKFRLQENLKVDQVKAAMENGVFIVTLQKEVKKCEIKSIEISS
ncbi:Small heat shock protein HSP20 protein [Dioscorea alata]|uniref:Small heat shock protein HSP20 protein n=1 Tax=Dioscorea alata TaxID=55571 RepID=A0ACB7V9N4_DIOAL|nr:Small heat shock protein HSP20 protein [Dioscorea alata]